MVLRESNLPYLKPWKLCEPFVEIHKLEPKTFGWHPLIPSI